MNTQPSDLVLLVIRAAQRIVFGGNGAGRPAVAVAHCQAAAANSAVLQRRTDGGLPLSRSYEAPAAGPFRSPSGTGGMHKAQACASGEAATVAVVRWAVYGAGPRREGVPAPCGGKRRDSVGGPPEAAHGCRAGAAGGTAKARSAASSTAAAYGRQWSVEF
jgi:hypothetical protein